MTDMNEEKDVNNISSRFLSQGHYYWNCLITKLQNLSDDEFVQQSINNCTSYLTDHPLLSLFALAMTVSCALPVIAFGIFAVFTILLTFTSFLLIEGAILAVGSVVLCGFIFAMLIIMLTMTASVAIAYFGFVLLFGNDKVSPKTRREQ